MAYHSYFAVGVVPLGSLGERAALGFEGKIACVRTLVRALGDTPVIPGIAAFATGEAVIHETIQTCPEV